MCGRLTGGAFLAQSVAAALGAEFYFTDRVAPPNGTGLYLVEYTLRPSIAAVARGKRVAIVDDVVRRLGNDRARCLTPQTMGGHLTRDTVIALPCSGALR